MRKKRSRQGQYSFTPSKKLKTGEDLVIPIKLFNSAKNKKRISNQNLQEDIEIQKSIKKISENNLSTDKDIEIKIEPFNYIENKTSTPIQNSKKNSKIQTSKKFQKKNLYIESFEENNIKLNTVNELHNNALKEFNEIKKCKNINYKTILDKIIKLYDLDEKINEYFLMKLKEYYENNKTRIDDDETGKSDDISALFFNYIYTLKYETRKKISNDFNYFNDKELFLETDKKYFEYNSMDKVFKSFIKELLEISSTIKFNKTKKTQKEYETNLSLLYSKYRFPNSSFKIPIKFGNPELMYMNFIIEFQTFLCIKKDTFLQKKFYSFKLVKKFLALNYFEDYFSKEVYDIFSIEYILFCLYTFFLYYDDDKYPIETIIQSQIFACSRFLYQSLDEKKKYLKELNNYIINIIDIDKIDENYLKNNLIKFKYNDKITEINVNNCYFLGDIETYKNDLINNNVYSFDYLKTINFPLFMDKKLNEDYNEYIKNILQSKITIEYINSFKNIPISEKTVFNDNIINEIKQNTFWVVFPLKNVHGISNRNNYTIFLNKNIIEYGSIKFCNILSSKVITSSHEYCNHIIRMIFSINNFNIEKITPINKELYKTEEYNDIINKYKDQGDIWENIIFGEKINQIFIMGSLAILNIENYNLDIKTFKEKFKKYNKISEVKEINKEINSLKKKENNKLIKHVKEYKEDDFKNNNWLQNEQYIIARNNSEINNGNNQYINFGICASHAFDEFI